MSMKRIYLVLIAALVLAAVAVFYPKEYARSGGIAGFPKDRECGCFGYKYEYYPAGCYDCFTTYHCAGILYNCIDLPR